jgi:uncharacterized membrane protein required for colicin V production
MDNWNGLDFFVFLIFAANTILGFARGAIREVISMMGLSVSLIFAIKFTVPLANFFNQSPSISSVLDASIIQNFMQAIGAGSLTGKMLYQVCYSVSLLICFMFPFSICEGALVRSGIVEFYTFPYVWWDRKVGGALGCIRGYVLSLFLLSILSLHLFAFSEDQAVMVHSFFVNLLQGPIQTFDSVISSQRPDQYQEIYKGRDLYKANEVLEKMGTQLLPPGSFPVPMPQGSQGGVQSITTPQGAQQGSQGATTGTATEDGNANAN